jgi:hypothetical protein
MRSIAKDVPNAFLRLSTAQVLELTGYTGTVQRELAELSSRPTDADDAAADQVGCCCCPKPDSPSSQLGRV